MWERWRWWQESRRCVCLPAGDGEEFHEVWLHGAQMAIWRHREGRRGWREATRTKKSEEETWSECLVRVSRSCVSFVHVKMSRGWELDVPLSSGVITGVTGHEFLSAFWALLIDNHFNIQIYVICSIFKRHALACSLMHVPQMTAHLHARAFKHPQKSTCEYTCAPVYSTCVYKAPVRCIQRSLYSETSCMKRSLYSEVSEYRDLWTHLWIHLSAFLGMLTSLGRDVIHLWGEMYYICGERCNTSVGRDVFTGQGRDAFTGCNSPKYVDKLTQAHIHMHTSTHTHVYTFKNSQIHIHIQIHKHLHKHSHTRTYTHTHSIFFHFSPHFFPSSHNDREYTRTQTLLFLISLEWLFFL